MLGQDQGATPEDEAHDNMPLAGNRPGVVAEEQEDQVTKRSKSRDLEHKEQVAFFSWLEKPNTLAKWPELVLFHAIPNGGDRDVRVAVKLKAEGVKSGVPDMMLPVASGGFHGLYIELKVGNNKPSENQAWWHGQLAAQGYAVFVCYSYPEARTVTEKYMRGGYRRAA